MAELDLAITAWIYEAKPAAAVALFPALSKYVVMTRKAPGCINVDYLQATANPDMFLVYEKWDAQESRDQHYASELFRQSASDMAAHLADPPTFIALDVISAYDEGGTTPASAVHLE